MPEDPATAEQAQDAALDQNARQIGYLTDAIKAIRTGQFQDLDTLYCALKGGLLVPDYTPSFPPATS